MIVSVDCDIFKWLSLIDKQFRDFSASKLLAASCLRCVNCRLNPSLFLRIVLVTLPLQPTVFD